jgi:hypothetical protein
MSEPLLRVLGFKKLAFVNGAGERVFRDWVIFAPAHAVQSTVNEELVERLRPKESYRGDDEGLKAVAMRARWAQIEPRYEAWKAGHEIPLSGTPLSTWPGVTDEQVEVLRMSAIRTVEEVAAMTDTQIPRINLPGMRDVRDQARRFLESLDANKAAENAKRRDEQIEALQDQVKQLLAERQAPAAVVSDDEPKRRGRPPKSSIMTVAEALETDDDAIAA